MKYAFAATLFAATFTLTGTVHAQEEYPKIGVYFSKPGVQRLVDGDDSNNPFLTEVTAGDQNSRIKIPATGDTGARFRVYDFNAPGAVTVSDNTNTGIWSGSGGVTANGGSYTTTAGRVFRRTANKYGGEWSGVDTPANANESYLTINAAYSGVPTGIVNINFASPLSYFGFFWSAGSDNNQIQLYGAGNVLLETFNTTRLMNTIGNYADSATRSVTTLGGQTHIGREYYGQPNTGEVANEPFLFLHFLANGVENAIHRIVLTNAVTSGGRAFESDNHTTAYWSETGQIYMPITTDDLVMVQPIPEPSTYALLGAAIGIGAWLRQRRLALR